MGLSFNVLAERSYTFDDKVNLRFNLLGAGSTVEGEVRAMGKGSLYFSKGLYYHYSMRGSVSAVTSFKRNEDYKLNIYDAFGQAVNLPMLSRDAVDLSVRSFTGQSYDRETGHYHFMFRE